MRKRIYIYIHTCIYIYIYIYLGHLAIQQKLTEQRKSIIIEKIKTLKKQCGDSLRFKTELYMIQQTSFPTSGYIYKRIENRDSNRYSMPVFIAALFIIVRK